MANQSLFDFADLPEWEQAALEDVQVAEVVFNLPLEKPYTYSIPDEFRELVRPVKTLIIDAQGIADNKADWIDEFSQAISR